ncbi:MAG: FkbM family methyltransferase [Rhodospirillales bacterium]|nr:FkbM family methyltransferase [Rhodospirillales bacterium]
MDLITTLATSKFPFKYKVFKALDRFGALSGELKLRVGGKDFHVPADQWYFWQLRDATRYQEKRLDSLCRLTGEFLADCHLLDLGADIGAVSRIMLAKMTNIHAVTALEPNPSAYRYLKANLTGLPIPAEALNIAVSDVSGLVNLERDASRQSDHSGFVRPDANGTTRAEPVDSFFTARCQDLLVKIDVEGQERAVFLGAQKTLRQARRVLLFVEIHRDVVDRTGISAEQIFSAAEAIRPCEWYLADPGTPPVDRARPFFDQFPARQYDVIGVMPS